MNTLPKIPRINRAKLIAMGRNKIHRACQIHYQAMVSLDQKDPRRRIHRGLLAQCGAALDT